MLGYQRAEPAATASDPVGATELEQLVRGRCPFFDSERLQVTYMPLPFLIKDAAHTLATQLQPQSVRPGSHLQPACLAVQHHCDVRTWQHLTHGALDRD